MLAKMAAFSDAAACEPHEAGVLTLVCLFLSALSELFAHYMEAWKSWYIELAQDSNSLELLSQVAAPPLS